MLREQLAAVEADLKRPAAALHQLDLELSIQVLEFSGQTGRLGVVVSSRAVLDEQFHACLRLKGPRDPLESGEGMYWGGNDAWGQTRAVLAVFDAQGFRRDHARSPIPG